MEKPQGNILILNSPRVSTKEVVSYLETVDLANDQIMKVLKKKPTLQGYKKLPWVIESIKDKNITTKLKKRKELDLSEILRLKEILNLVLNILKRGRPAVPTESMTGLENYINNL